MAPVGFHTRVARTRNLIHRGINMHELDNYNSSTSAWAVACSYTSTVLIKCVRLIAYPFVEYPAKMLYFNGPAVFGFWEGKGPAEICERLTTIESSFWGHGHITASECLNLIQRKYQAFLLVVYFLLYCVVVLQCIRRRDKNNISSRR